MTPRQISLSTWLLLLLLALIWGASFLAVRTALDEIPPLTSVAHRVVWGAAVLWLLGWFKGERLPTDTRTLGALFVMGCLNNAIPFSLMAWGQLHIESGLTAILNAASAIWGVLVAALVFADERLTLRRVVGVLLGFVGVVTAIGLRALLDFDLRSVAQLAVVGGTVSYAVAGSWARATLKGLSPIVAAGGMLTGSSLLMVPLAITLDGPPDLTLSLTTWTAIAYYGIAATALAYLLYFRILARAGASNLLLVTLLIPPVAIVLGALVRGESLTASAYAGFVLLAAGLLILDGRFPRRAARASPTA